MNHKFLLSVAVLFAAGLHAFPPPAPSAGVIEREIEKEYEGKPLEPEKEIPSIEIDIPEEKLDLPDGVKVKVCQVEIEGNEAISSQEISGWLQLQDECSMQDIHQLCTTISQHYARKGYFLARAYPPPQTIENGVLKLRVLEGKIGNIEVVGNHRYPTSFILKYVSHLEHKPLRYDPLTRAILLLNEVSDLHVGAVLQKGKEVGTADLILRVQDAYPIHFSVNENNYGRKLTTKARLGGKLDWGSVLKYGDGISATEVIGFPVDALYFTDVRYKFPLNANGTFIGASYLYSKFDVEELQPLHLRGKSVITTVKAEHALIRKKNLSLDLFTYFDVKQIQNFTMNTLTSFDKLRVWTFGGLLDHYNPLQGRDYFTFRASVGIPGIFGGMGVDAPQSSRLGAGGRFFKLNFDYDRLQHFRKDYYLYLHASAQIAPWKLTLPEQIYIGGADTVRGFPLAAALGDSGYYLNAEFRFPPPFLANQRFFVARKKWREVVQVVAFLDHGGVVLDGGGEFFQPSHKIFLWGSGIGIRVKGPRNWGLSLDVGFPLNHDSLSSGAFTYLKVTGQLF